MKKVFILFLFIGFSSSSFAQTIDTNAIKQELQRLNQINDSIIREQQNKLQIEKEKGSLTVEPIAEEPTTAELTAEKIEENLDKAMKEHDKETITLRNRILILAAAVLIIMLWMRRVLNKQEQKKQKRKTSSI